MPDSIAAWRTVLPFGTETWRPSMVSVTMSINRDHIRAVVGSSGPSLGAAFRRPAESPSARKRTLRPVEFGNRGRIEVDLDAADRHVDRNDLLHFGLRQRNDYVARAAVGHGQRHGHRQVEHQVP